jgi:FkbM family methyltransferase
MYSQNNEEEFILTFFKYRQRGLFLDIGAFDPFALSNTRALYERGWSGVLVEPGKNQIKKLEDEYKNSDRIEICPYAIAENNGEFDFYVTPDDALSTLDEDHLIKWKDINFIKIFT